MSMTNISPEVKQLISSLVSQPVNVPYGREVSVSAMNAVVAASFGIELPHYPYPRSVKEFTDVVALLNGSPFISDVISNGKMIELNPQWKHLAENWDYIKSVLGKADDPQSVYRKDLAENLLRKYYILAENDLGKSTKDFSKEHTFIGEFGLEIGHQEYQKLSSKLHDQFKPFYDSHQDVAVAYISHSAKHQVRDEDMNPIVPLGTAIVDGRNTAITAVIMPAEVTLNGNRLKLTDTYDIALNVDFVQPVKTKKLGM